jgi:hypothetical protein
MRVWILDHSERFLASAKRCRERSRRRSSADRSRSGRLEEAQDETARCVIPTYIFDTGAMIAAER